jgi:hypothetical protein
MGFWGHRPPHRFGNFKRIMGYFLMVLLGRKLYKRWQRYREGAVSIPYKGHGQDGQAGTDHIRGPKCHYRGKLIGDNFLSFFLEMLKVLPCVFILIGLFDVWVKVATLAHMDKIIQRSHMLKQWTRQLTAELVQLGVKMYPSETYFFLADFAPYTGKAIAEALAARQILVRPLDDARLGAGFIRLTTACPEDNAKVLRVISHFLKSQRSSRKRNRHGQG